MTDERGADPELASELQKAGEELKSLEAKVKTGMVDMRVLIEFRTAMNHMRHTAWAVQKWVEEEQRKGGDPFAVLAMVMAERVRVTTLVATELAHDIESGDVDFQMSGLPELYRAIKNLLDLLRPFVKQ